MISETQLHRDGRLSGPMLKPDASTWKNNRLLYSDRQNHRFPEGISSKYKECFEIICFTSSGAQTMFVIFPPR